METVKKISTPSVKELDSAIAKINKTNLQLDAFKMLKKSIEKLSVDTPGLKKIQKFVDGVELMSS